jgi:hypothetical protein
MAGISMMLIVMQNTSALAADSRGLEKKEVLGALSVDKQHLRWHGLRIGMTLRQLEHVLGSKISFKEVDGNLCGGVMVQANHRGRKLEFDLVGGEGKETLAVIFIPFVGSEKALPLGDLVTTLKKRIPSVIYQPSRHEPNVKEADNLLPVYLLKDRPEMAIFLRPGKGFYVGFEGCLG